MKNFFTKKIVFTGLSMAVGAALYDFIDSGELDVIKFIFITLFITIGIGVYEKVKNN